MRRATRVRCRGPLIGFCWTSHGVRPPRRVYPAGSPPPGARTSPVPSRPARRVVNYVDYTLVRLADDGLRRALFDQDALEQLTFAAYDADAMALGPPYSAIFDELVAGVSMPHRSTAEAVWNLSSGSDRRDGRVTLFGLGSDPRIRVDALWRGALVARAVSPLSRITRAITGWSNTGGLDEEIAR